MSCHASLTRHQLCQCFTWSLLSLRWWPCDRPLRTCPPCTIPINGQISGHRRGNIDAYLAIDVRKGACTDVSGIKPLSFNCRAPCMRVGRTAGRAAGRQTIVAAMAQPGKPVSPADMAPSAGATQSLNFEPFQEVRSVSHVLSIFGQIHWCASAYSFVNTSFFE